MSNEDKAAPSFDPAFDKTPEEIARIQALPNHSRLTDDAAEDATFDYFTRAEPPKETSG